MMIRRMLVGGGLFGLAVGISGLSMAPALAAGKNVLIYGRGGDSVSLDPAKETDGESLNVCDNLFDTLVTFKPGTTEIIPSLAESWTVLNQGLRYQFQLVKNAKFHDGTPVNADAVIFSMMRQHDKSHEAFGYAPTWSYWNDMGMDKLIKSVSKLDEHTVVFDLNRIEAPFLANLAMNFAAIVSPTAVRKLKENFAKSPVGSGPFKFTSWTKGEKIILDANKEYFKGVPKIDRLIFRSIPDNSSRLNAFLAKEIHMMNLPTPDQVNVIKQKRKDAKVIMEPAMNVSYLAFNTQKAPFDNPKVRQAINMAINKEAIIKGIYNGVAKLAVNPMPPNIWGYNATIKPYEYSAEKAKKMLEEAGIKTPIKMELYFLPVSRPYMPDGKKVAEAIQSDLKKVGIELTLTTYEWAVYLDKTKKGEHQMALMGWTGDNGDPDNFLHVLLSGENASSPASNIAFYKNEKVTKLLNDAKTLPTQAQRVKLYEEAQTLIHGDAPWVPIAHSTVAMPMDKKVEGFALSPTGSRNFFTTEFTK